MNTERATTIDERRWSGGAWLTLLAVALIWLAAIASAVAALRKPTDGWIAPQGEIPPPLAVFVGDWPTPLQVGDRVTAVADVSMLSDFTALGTPIPPPLGWVNGGSVLYHIMRAGQPLTVTVPIRQLDNPGIVRAFAAAVSDNPSEWGYFVIGALIFALRPGSAAARLLFFFGGSHAAVTKLIWAVPNIISFTTPPVFYAIGLINGAWGYAIIPALLLLTLTFPRRTWLVRRFPRLAPALIFGVSGVLSALAVFTGNGVLAVVLLVVLTLSFVLGLVTTSTLTLWRSRDPVARAQTGWVLLGIGLSIGVTLIYYQATSWFPQSVELIDALVPRWFARLFALALPICLGIAILRYRLFDIEIIIRQTLLYAVLTLTLGATYVIGVVLLQALFVRLTGQESALAVVASTLAIAALFGPLRRRVQAIIDRRFFRRKYDARQVLAQFALRAQQQADLDTLAGDILQVVQETVQPEQAHIWLIPNKEQRP